MRQTYRFTRAMAVVSFNLAIVFFIISAITQHFAPMATIGFILVGYGAANWGTAAYLYDKDYTVARGKQDAYRRIEQQSSSTEVDLYED